MLRATRHITGHEKLRRKLPAIPALENSSSTAAIGNTPSPGLPPGVTNTAGWSNSKLREHLEKTRDKIAWSETTGSARKWWLAFESENESRLPLVVRLEEELLSRKATVTEFFLAYVYSNTDNIQENLHYLDYTRLKKSEEALKKQKAEEAARKQKSEGKE